MGSVFHVVTFSLLQVLIYIHDPLQISSVTGTGQLQVQWEDVPSTVANNTSQGTPWNPHYTNGVNYGSDSAGYPELSSVSNDVQKCTITVPINLLVVSQDRASPVTHPSVGPAHQQGIPEHVQVMFHVRYRPISTAYGPN
jgi:hypothetical protein